MKCNKELIFTSLAIVGVAVTTIVTAIMAPKAKEAIKAKKADIYWKNTKIIIVEDGSKEIDAESPEAKQITTLTTADRIELVKAAAPFYAPSAFLCILTIGVILFNQKEHI